MTFYDIIGKGYRFVKDYLLANSLIKENEKLRYENQEIAKKVRNLGTILENQEKDLAKIGVQYSKSSLSNYETRE